MAFYKHFCIYCDKLIPGDSNICPYCGAEDPFIARCPKCRQPIEKGYSKCPSCGMDMSVACPDCGCSVASYLKQCPGCGASLMARCIKRKCGNIQLYTITQCIRCKSRVNR